MHVRACIRGGRSAIEVCDDGGYKTVWQKRSGKWTPIVRARHKKGLKVLPHMTREEHYKAVLQKEAELKGTDGHFERTLEDGHEPHQKRLI